MALLGSGFDPGVTNVFCAYAQKHLFDEIHTIDILDCNAGSHGMAFATNFNPEINIRENTQRGKYWEHGKWIETDPLSVHQSVDYPEIGPKESYITGADSMLKKLKSKREEIEEFVEELEKEKDGKKLEKLLKEKGLRLNKPLVGYKVRKFYRRPKNRKLIYPAR